jgi:hypothetical protein
MLRKTIESGTKSSFCWSIIPVIYKVHDRIQYSLSDTQSYAQ